MVERASEREREKRLTTQNFPEQELGSEEAKRLESKLSELLSGSS